MSVEPVIEGEVMPDKDPREKIRGTFAVFVQGRDVYLSLWTEATGDVQQKIPPFVLGQLLRQRPDLKEFLGV